MCILVAKEQMKPKEASRTWWNQHLSILIVPSIVLDKWSLRYLQHLGHFCLVSATCSAQYSVIHCIVLSGTTLALCTSVYELCTAFYSVVHYTQTSRWHHEPKLKSLEAETNFALAQTYCVPRNSMSDLVSHISIAGGTITVMFLFLFSERWRSSELMPHQLTPDTTCNG